METGVKEPLELTTKEPATPPVVTSLNNEVKSNSTNDLQNKNEGSKMSDKYRDIEVDDSLHKDSKDTRVNATNVTDKMLKLNEESTVPMDIKSDKINPKILNPSTPMKAEPGDKVVETTASNVKSPDGIETTAAVQPDVPTTVKMIPVLEPTTGPTIKPSMNSSNIDQLTVQPLNPEPSKTNLTTIEPSTPIKTTEIAKTSSIQSTTHRIEATSTTIEVTTTHSTIESTSPTTVEPTTAHTTIEPKTSLPTTTEQKTTPTTIEPTTTTELRTTPTTSEPTKPTTSEPTTTPEPTQPVTSKPTPKPSKPTSTTSSSTTEEKATLAPENPTTPYIETTNHTTTEPPFNLGKAIGDGFQNKDPLVIGITVGAGVLVLIILILVIVCICRCRRRRQNQPKMRHANRHDIARGSIDDIFRDKGYTRLAHKEHNTDGNHPNPIEMSPLLRNRSVMNRNVMNRDVLNTTGQTFLGNDDTITSDSHNHSGDDPSSPLTTPNEIDSPSELSRKPNILDPNLYEVDLSTEDLNVGSANEVPTKNGDIEDTPFVVVNENNPFNANNNKPRSYIRDSNTVGDDENNPFDNAPRPNPFRTSRTVNDYQYE